MTVDGSEVMNETVNGSSLLIESGFSNWEDKGIAGRGTFAQDSLFQICLYKFSDQLYGFNPYFVLGNARG